ncbi:hypothetical protein FCM35_KLT04449 [Carex littledalei]|uniref:Uncharacterized protein n=1 Tax=Carex littledalei TaxID=544730 RepID=A0A833VL98_9POAL|nr:hypothetical protein FCM35_KLT04449 [Carex littledalei]
MEMKKIACAVLVVAASATMAFAADAPAPAPGKSDSFAIAPAVGAALGASVLWRGRALTYCHNTARIIILLQGGAWFSGTDMKHYIIHDMLEIRRMRGAQEVIG